MDQNSDENGKRPQFGNRLLTNENQVFEHNAWDNVIWDDNMEEEALAKVAVNSENKVIISLQCKYETDADAYWDKFYTNHQNRFFKDRHWLCTEFPELFPTTLPDRLNCDKKVDEDGVPSFFGSKASYRILEVGCGVGNTVFPVVKSIGDKSIYVYGCDFSSTAVDILKESPFYSESQCHAFVCDVADEAAALPFPENALDVIVMIFVLSAINPDKMSLTVSRLSRHLKPGGVILFRDYGRFDMAQMRFKNGQCLQDNFYVRGDGTRVYFFTQEELRSMFLSAGLQEEQNAVDRRLLVNRGRQLKMYRVWIQCKYRKMRDPLPQAVNSSVVAEGGFDS